MDRRIFLQSLCGGLATNLCGAAEAGPARLGIAEFSFAIRQGAERGGRFRSDRPLTDPLQFVEYCQRLGAGGVQLALGQRDATYARDLRRAAEEHGMFLEGSGAVPRTRADADRFETEIRTAQQAGADVLRVVLMAGRRYERFTSAEEFRAAAEQARQSLEWAEPIAARYRMRIAVENHKDQRLEERLALLKHLSSEYVGVCLDTGNDVALLEDPLQVVAAYAPWTFTVHLKDQALRATRDGFLLADVVLGAGCLDLPAMIATLRQARAGVRFTLEMSTRDPLPVPCLTERYWASLRDVPARDLARTLRLVRDKSAAVESLPRVDHLPLDQRIALEEANVTKCLAYARQRLGL